MVAPKAALQDFVSLAEYAQCLVDGDRVWAAAEARLRFPQLSEPVRRVKGRERVGLHYGPVFPHFGSLPGAYVVLPAHFVSAADGTGIVHLAPAFGEDDEVVCRAAGISGPMPVTDDGTFTHEVPEFAGTTVFEASSCSNKR